jgi:4-oxalocrotonate tautomerase
MPFIECHITRGLTPERRHRLIRDIIEVTHEAIGSDPKIINVVLHEHGPDNVSVSGRIGGQAFKDKSLPRAG